MAVSPYDEFLIHQTTATLDQLANSDPQWTERVWFSAFEKSGAYQLLFGLGKYHNRNVMDCSIALVADGEVQYNVRASRRLWPDLDRYAVGPIEYSIPEPLHSVRIVTDRNESGFSCDVRFIGETEIYLQDPPMFRRRAGRTVNEMNRYFQTGALEGWIEIEGRRIEVSRADWWASRDRSWGLRSNTTERTDPDGRSESSVNLTEPPGDGMPYRWSFFTMQFEDWSASFEFAQTPSGQRLGPALGHLQHAPHTQRAPQKIVHVDHVWDHASDGLRLLGIKSTLHLDDGTTKAVSMEPISIGFRRPGGGHYGGYGDWVQGAWLGDLRVEGDKIELTDETARELHMVEDYALKLNHDGHVGWGVAEPLIPGVSELLTTG